MIFGTYVILPALAGPRYRGWDFEGAGVQGYRGIGLQYGDVPSCVAAVRCGAAASEH